MQTVTMQATEQTSVNIISVGGDLRITGREGTDIVIQATRDGALSVEESAQAVDIQCSTNCTIFMGPPQVGQTVTSTLNTLASSLAQDVRPVPRGFLCFLGAASCMGKTSWGLS